jgi:cytochrome c oxidase cbb3-type subunit 3
MIYKILNKISMEIKDHNLIEKDELTGDKLLSGHEYDNIRELDNSLPKWWTWLFIITIVWSVVYVTQYDLLRAWPYQDQEYQKEMAEAGVPAQGSVAAAVDTNMVAMTDKASLDEGALIWDKNCKVCHLQGQGLVGPNLTDQFSIHGCKFSDIVKIIVVGAPEKGMISWKGQLSDDQIKKVASYSISLVGQNFPNPKAAQGEPCK